MKRLKLSVFLLLVCTVQVVAAGGYALQVSGPTAVHQGYTMYVSAVPTFEDEPSSVFWVGLEGPPGVTGAMVTRFRSAAGTPFAWYGPGKSPVPFQIEITAAQTVSPGTYQLNVVTERNGAQLRSALTLRVKPVVAVEKADSAPPDPLDTSRWERVFLTLGAKWCRPGEVMKWGYEQQVWYYDGGRVYLQMAEHFRDSQWEPCAFNILDQYRDAVLSQGGWGQGWRVFTKGLRMAYERTGDQRYKEAVHLLASKSPYAATGGQVSDTAIRETAFILQAYVDDSLLGSPRDPNMARAAAFLIGHFEALFETGSFAYHQTFMDGLAAEALIDYYDLTSDPRVPGTVRMMLDWIWEKGWDDTAHALVYNPEPLGPRCSNTCQEYRTELINLVAPAFAWYWKVSGNREYLRRGDILFSHALDTDISYSGKIFSQNFRWSPSYLYWRGDPARPRPARRPASSGHTR